MITSSMATRTAESTFILRGANWERNDSTRSPDSSTSARPLMRQPPNVLGLKTRISTWGFSLMLAMVAGEAISAKATCSSSSTLKDPFGETLGFPVLLAVATKAGCVAAMIRLASSDNLAVMTHLLIERILASAGMGRQPTLTRPRRSQGTGAHRARAQVTELAHRRSPSSRTGPHTQQTASPTRWRDAAGAPWGETIACRDSKA